MRSWRCRHVYENSIGAELLIFWMLVLRGAAFAAWQVLVALSIDFGRPCYSNYSLIGVDRIQHREVEHVHFGFSVSLLYCEEVSNL
jgi:hypothetical protein